jgi:bifunctional non-homologous end joining protein LigD
MNRPPIFVVHEHHASRVHFDVRLELDGVLKSWAVPKGPSMNPAEKRLAVMVDDHPLDYAEFEGVIPEGRYGAGPVVIWDHGTFTLLEGTSDEGLKRGSLTINLDGTRLKGAFALVQLKGPRTTGKEWLLMKKTDQHADPSFVLQSSLTPARRKRLKETILPCDTS